MINWMSSSVDCVRETSISKGSFGGHARIHSSKTDRAISTSSCKVVQSSSRRARYPLGRGCVAPSEAIVMLSVLCIETPLMMHKTRLDNTQMVVRCSVMHEIPMCLTIFAKQSAVPSTLYSSSSRFGTSSSNQVHMVMRKISMAVRAILQKTELI